MFLFALFVRISEGQLIALRYAEWYFLSSRGLKARGDPLWTRKRRDKSESVLETRWIAASDCRLSRNDKLHVVTEPHTSFLHTLVIARAESPWRSTVSRKPSRTVRMRPLHAVDCRVPRSASSSQWQVRNVIKLHTPLLELVLGQKTTMNNVFSVTWLH